MKHKIVYLIGVALACFVMTLAGTSAAECKTRGDNGWKAGDKLCWTVLLYLNSGGDAELDEALRQDLEELAEAGAPKGVEIVVQYFDQASANAPITAWLYRLRPSGERGSQTGWRGAFEELDKSEPGSFNDPKALTSGLVTAISRFPAARYALVIGSHGSGMRAPVVTTSPAPHAPAVPNQGTRGAGGLLNRELRAALAESKTELKERWLGLDLLAFDSCLMSTVEVAYGVAPYARYMTASQAPENLFGWDYERLVKAYSDAALTGNPAEWSGGDLARLIVQHYPDTLPTTPAKKKLTIATLDLGRFDDSSAGLAALDRLGQGLVDLVQEQEEAAWNEIGSARSQCQEFGYRSEKAPSSAPPTNGLSIDVWCFAKMLTLHNLRKTDVVNRVEAAATSVIDSFRVPAWASQSPSGAYRCSGIGDLAVRQGCFGASYNDLVRGVSVYFPWRLNVAKDHDGCGYREDPGSSEDRPNFVSDRKATQGDPDRGGWVRWIRRVGAAGKLNC